MKNTEMEIVMFGNEDVIATSVGFTLSGYNNGKSGDAAISIGGQSYGYAAQSEFEETINDALAQMQYAGPKVTKIYISRNSGSGYDEYTLFNAFQRENNADNAAYDIWNGYYRYNANEQKFIKVSAN